MTSKLNAINRNTETQRQFFVELREKAQVSLSIVRFGAKEIASFALPLSIRGQLRPEPGNSVSYAAQMLAGKAVEARVWIASLIV